MLSLINSLHKWMKIGLSIKKLYIESETTLGLGKVVLALSK